MRENTAQQSVRQLFIYFVIVSILVLGYTFRVFPPSSDETAIDYPVDGSLVAVGRLTQIVETPRPGKSPEYTPVIEFSASNGITTRLELTQLSWTENTYKVGWTAKVNYKIDLNGQVKPIRWAILARSDKPRLDGSTEILIILCFTVSLFFLIQFVQSSRRYFQWVRTTSRT